MCIRASERGRSKREVVGRESPREASKQESSLEREYIEVRLTTGSVVGTLLAVSLLLLRLLGGILRAVGVGRIGVGLVVDVRRRLEARHGEGREEEGEIRRRGKS